MQISTPFQPTEMGMTLIYKYKRSVVLFLEISMPAHRELRVQKLQLGLGSINYSQSAIIRNAHS